MLRLAMRLALLLLIASVGFAITTTMDHAAWITTPGNFASYGEYALGWQFTLSSPYTVVELGYFDFNGDGFNENHDVGIYACGDPSCTLGSLLVSATVMTADPIQNGFRWTPVTSYTLPAGDYVIAGTSGTELYQWSGGTVNWDPRVTWTEGRYIAGSSLQFPNVVNPNPPISYFGPNFGTVPEPGTLYLLGCGALLLLGRRFRKA